MRRLLGARGKSPAAAKAEESPAPASSEGAEAAAAPAPAPGPSTGPPCTGSPTKSADRMRTSMDPTQKTNVLPEPLRGGAKVEDATLATVPDTAALAKWLADRGLDTKDWGRDDTKDVGKFWKEMQGDEAGLEVWKKTDGTLQPVRVVHVLRAKVCSPESYERGIFLLNTWQQYGDGRVRTRNGLLSEKLTVSEMPLENNLHEVCQRAVTEEEMQTVTESLLKIGPGVPAPTFDPTYKCPLKVVQEKFVDHTIELETSKSYPGLLTMYHLYTVDIICSGLPVVDFNTLEFNGPDSAGRRSLKYIHAWVWTEWSQIQRYLLEGSELKERKKRGSFSTHEVLLEWLDQFDLDLDVWGTASFSSAQDLFRELENEETHLELWGRHDGVPLLMRVVHVVQLKIGSTDFRQSRKFLFNTWQQLRDGSFRTVNRLMAKKVSTAQLPFTEARFTQAAEDAVREELTYIMDAHFQLDPNRFPAANSMAPSGVSVSWVRFEDHRVTVEESMSFKGLQTMYHFYTMEVECEGLPLADFSSLEFRQSSGSQELRFAHGWRWVKWQQTLDILQNRTQALVKSAEVERVAWEDQSQGVDLCNAHLKALNDCLDTLAKKLSMSPADLQATQQFRDGVGRLLRELGSSTMGELDRAKEGNSANLAKLLPPTMVSKMSEGVIASRELLEEAQASKLRHAAAQAARKEAMRGNGFSGFMNQDKDGLPLANATRTGSRPGAGELGGMGDTREHSLPGAEGSHAENDDLEETAREAVSGSWCWCSVRHNASSEWRDERK